MTRARIVTSLLTAILATAPLAAYTVVMKDGSKLIAGEKYRLEGENALILINGMRTSIEASEIDFAATEAENTGDYGTALVLQDGKVTELGRVPAPPSQKTLGDLIAGGDAATRSRPEARRQARVPETGTGRTPAGYVDLLEMDRTPHANIDLAGEIRRSFTANGIDQVQVFQGTRRDRTMVEVTANSEASVFRAILAAGQALLQIRQQFGADVEAFELFVVTERRLRGGQFVVTREDAEALLNGGIDVTAFFVQRVEF